MWPIRILLVGDITCGLWSGILAFYLLGTLPVGYAVVLANHFCVLVHLCCTYAHECLCVYLSMKLFVNSLIGCIHKLTFVKMLPFMIYGKFYSIDLYAGMIQWFLHLCS